MDTLILPKTSIKFGLPNSRDWKVKLVYLDHAGATLYSETQMEMILKDFTTNVYGNPHSQSDTSSSTSDLVRSARQQVLEYFNASPKDYKCIFTSGATAALKLVGEAFPWTKESCFVYTMENHNSVLGIRETPESRGSSTNHHTENVKSCLPIKSFRYALSKGAAALAVDVEEIENQNGHPRNDLSSLKLSQRSAQRRSRTEILEDIPTANSLGSAYNLFAFPSECNFSGMKFSLDLVKLMKENSERALEGSPYSSGWSLINAAKGCATQPPDLARFPADFVAISFYKIFGYPTGLGALVVRTGKQLPLTCSNSS
ncbi:hypothetical protein C5167_036695 [Papaver somniferum]|uniref:Aminotransferase class V domain-containing protein n=1 Tax=Papaver somniferum TaxID=3469 RepID=A0A4Y7I7D7_PAPSO|nr:hypothetical protein C5167_036695 [Papaver somniferum]